MTLDRPPHQLVATVLGAGTMGAQIAAHLANAGIRTYLLDIVPKNASRGASSEVRNALAAAAIKHMVKAKPPPFMDAAFAARITPGNLEDDLEPAIATSDLVLEAVVERLDVKRPLFDRIAKAAAGHAVLATNTSGLPIAAIAEGLAENVRRRVIGMHFFNPPRYMHLLEIVPSAYTDPAVARDLALFSDRLLGKGIVVCRDTPNFIGNRIGIAEMLLTNRATFEGGYTVEEVDLLNGPIMGRPRTGSFRLGDLVGIDVAAHVIRNLRQALSGDPGQPNYDRLFPIMTVHPQIESLIQQGSVGDKVGRGFYMKTADAKGGRVILSLDLATLEYRERIEPQFPELAEVARIPDLRRRIQAALRVEGRAGEFLRRVYLPLFNYAADQAGEICDSPKEIDDAMRWGYGWKLGPFAMWDAAGLSWGAQQLEAMGETPSTTLRALLETRGSDASWYEEDPAEPKVWVPQALGHCPIETPPGMLILASRKAAVGEIHTTATASLIDLGDGVACVEFRSKMNILDDGVTTMLRESFGLLERAGGFRALVVGNQGEHFSAGADARQILAWAEAKQWDAIDQAVARFQDTFMALRHGPIPVVAAPHGMTLGGGTECALHCAAKVAHAELYMGLVEAGIGLVPAGGGLKEMCRRASSWASQVPDGDPYPWLRRAFECTSTARTSSSAHEARRLGFLAPDDTITFHKDRVIADAKRRAVALAEAGWMPPDPAEPIKVVGAAHGASFLMGAWLFHQGGYASDHDKLVAEKIAHVLSGGMSQSTSEVTSQFLLDLEREAFVSLCGEEKTRARIAHTLATGKPLRN